MVGAAGEQRTTREDEEAQHFTQASSCAPRHLGLPPALGEVGRKPGRALLVAVRRRRAAVGAHLGVRARRVRRGVRRVVLVEEDVLLLDVAVTREAHAAEALLARRPAGRADKVREAGHGRIIARPAAVARRGRRAQRHAVEVLDLLVLLVREGVVGGVRRGGRGGGDGAREREGAVRALAQVQRVRVYEQREVDLADGQNGRRRRGAAHLEQPRADDDGGGETLLVVPDGHGGVLALLGREVRCRRVAEVHHLLLRGRVGLLPAVVGRPEPPDDGEEDGPGRREYVVGEEEVRKVERLLGLLLWTG